MSTRISQSLVIDQVANRVHKTPEEEVVAKLLVKIYVLVQGKYMMQEGRAEKGQ